MNETQEEDENLAIKSSDDSDDDREDDEKIEIKCQINFIIYVSWCVNEKYKKKSYLKRVFFLFANNLFQTFLCD